MCIISEGLLWRQVGALEYDPELVMQQHHREFLRDKVVFKEVVPISDPALRAKIHQTYRLAYLKDVVLPRVLDDATFATFSSLILFNNVEVWRNPSHCCCLCHDRSDPPLHEALAAFPEISMGLVRVQPRHIMTCWLCCALAAPCKVSGISGNAGICASTSSLNEAALISYPMWWWARRWSWLCKGMPSFCRSCSRG